MSKTILRIRGKIDKILKTDVQGSTIVLFKNENEIAFNLKNSIIMVEISKCQWKSIEANTNLLDLYLDITGKFEIRATKENKPYLYVKSVACKKLKVKAQEDIIRHLNKMSENYEREIKTQKRHYDNIWFKNIDENEFQEIDINKVKLVEEIHLNSKISVFNIKKYNNYNDLSPISVRENDNGEYELVTGIRSFIVAKLLSRKVRAYTTTLSRNEFKEKYLLEI